MAAMLVGALLPGAVGVFGAGPRDDAARQAALPDPGTPLGPGTHEVRLLRTEVQKTLAHDPQAFTQGLEFRGGTLYESTGLSGESSVRAGPPGKPPTVRAELPTPLFGEGITLAGDKLWHITWRDGIAVERDPVSLVERRRVTYRGEGWGLCHQRGPGQSQLVLSDGSDRLTFRDPETFRPTGYIHVRHDGRPVTRLNELECADDGSLYANVYRTDTIVRIDPRTGAVIAHIDAAGLLTASERRGARELNGIAAVPGTGEFLLTGKLWPRMFQVAFVPR
jgi:glutamine cyclotransferase